MQPKYIGLPKHITSFSYVVAPFNRSTSINVAHIYFVIKTDNPQSKIGGSASAIKLRAITYAIHIKVNRHLNILELHKNRIIKHAQKTYTHHATTYEVCRVVTHTFLFICFQDQRERDAYIVLDK